ncbi:MAG: Kazal-type serine protease inhibitor domain-containing protein [Acidobacteriota bacterium]
MKSKITPFAFLVLALILTAGAASAQSGQTCGGIGGLQCPAGQGCLYPSGKCNQPDLAGTCIAVQDPCPSGGPQICGCDGTTYANRCAIATAGVRPDHNGPCTQKSQASTDVDPALDTFLQSLR